MPDGLGEALSRFNKTRSEGPGEVDDPTAGSDTGKGSKSSTGGHSFHIHKHTDGSHHLTIHGKHGQLMHHSEHASFAEAHEEMAKHGGSSGSPGESGIPSEASTEG